MPRYCRQLNDEVEHAWQQWQLLSVVGGADQQVVCTRRSSDETPSCSEFGREVVGRCYCRSHDFLAQRRGMYDKYVTIIVQGCIARIGFLLSLLSKF